MIRDNNALQKAVVNLFKLMDLADIAQCIDTHLIELSCNYRLPLNFRVQCNELADKLDEFQLPQIGVERAVTQKGIDWVKACEKEDRAKDKAKKKTKTGYQGEFPNYGNG